MIKPDHIDAFAWEAAVEAYEIAANNYHMWGDLERLPAEWESNLHEQIALAIMAEREECAKIAEDMLVLIVQTIRVSLPITFPKPSASIPRRGKVMSELTERYKLMESALEFMLMAYDSDEDYRRHCGVGNDVSFPGYKGPVQSVSEVRRILKRDGEGNQK